MKKLYASVILALALCVSLTAQELKDSTLLFPWHSEMTYDQTTGNAVKVTESQLEKRGMGDLRNRFTGLVPGMEVLENGGGVYSGATGNFCNYNFGSGAYDVNMKGFSASKVIVDDVTIPFNQLLLDPNQIESITVISDVLDKAKYGPMASYGALYITTKKGGYNQPFRVNFDVEVGLNMLDKVPEWVSGAEYATLNNRAREADGYPTLYTDEAIEAFTHYNYNDTKYPCVDYKSLRIRDLFMSERFGFNASAGSKNIKYNISLNTMHYDDFQKSTTTSDYNKLNVSASVTAKIGRYVEASAGFHGLLSYRATNRTSWYTYRSVPETAYPLVLGKVGSLGEEGGETEGLEQDRTIYGVSKTWPDNYYAKMIEGGYQTIRNRSGLFYANVDLDMSFLLKGLKSKTMVEASNFLSTTIGKNNDYIAYYWDPTYGIQEISDHKGIVQTSRSTSSTTTSQIFSLYQRFLYDWERCGHKLGGGLTYYMYSAIQSGDSYRQRQMNFSADFHWSYMGRYSVELVAQGAGSSRFKTGSKFGFFPTLGLSWTASNEKFLKDVRWIDRLRIHAQAGRIGDADLFGNNYLYQASYSQTSGMVYGPTMLSGEVWFGDNTHTSLYTTIDRLANSQLTWEAINQVDLGIDFDVLKCLRLSASGYGWTHTGQIVDILSSLPYIYGVSDASVYGNYEEDRCLGYDVNLTFDKHWGDFGFRAGVDVYNWSKTYTKLVSDEYSEEYQKKTGTSVNAIWGLVCTGKYSSQEEIDNNPSYVDKSTLRVGDLMYKDVNGDGNVDTNDRVIIGDYNPKLRYSVNLGFSWKDLEFQIVGTGRVGGTLAMTGSYFWNGWGDSNYTAFVRDNIGGSYPRLSYVKSTNNFVVSDFWMRDGSWFKIQSAELAYNLKLRKEHQSIRFSIKGENLCTITGVQYVDPEAIDSGISDYPLFRLVSFGAKFNF